MFQDFDLGAPLLGALEARGIAEPTPIQIATLPHTLAGRDVLGRARTGTGKTLAFALPVAKRLLESDGATRAPRALVLAPTRELAQQVAGEFGWLAPALRTVAIYGGAGYGSQAATLKRGVDVVVATPGRARDYLERGVMDLSAIEFVVLDEADEMLSMGFEEEVEALLGATPSERQTLLFSATMPRWAERLASQHQRDPLRVDVAADEQVSYRELAMEIPLPLREEILSDVLHVHGGAGAIVFTRTKAEVDRLAAELNSRGHRAEAVHGDLDQKARERAIARFREDGRTVLVGTEVAARGLDIPEVELVVHFRLPSNPQTYQHRSGRTGRAGRAGTVVTLHGNRERREMLRLEQAVGRRFERVGPPRPEEVRAARLAALEAQLAATPERDRDAWREIAQEWIEKNDVEAVASLLARLLGGLPASRSLLTGEGGWTTLELAGPDGGIGGTGAVVRVLKEAGAGELGRIVATRGASFVDVRPDVLERLSLPAGVTAREAERAPAPAPTREPRKGGRSGPRREGRGPRRSGGYARASRD